MTTAPNSSPIPYPNNDVSGAPEWPVGQEYPVEYNHDGTPIWPTRPAYPEQEIVAEGKLGAFLANAALAGLVAFELSPLNEVSRLAAAGVTGAVTHNPELGAGAFALSTLIVEGVGAVATAKLLETSNAQWAIDRASKLLEHLNVSKGIRTDALTDVGLSLLLGVPVVMMLKHLQDPSRTYEQNVKFGLALALGTSAVIGGESFAVAKGVTKASSLPLLGGVIAGGAALYQSVKTLAKERLARSAPYPYHAYTRLVQDGGPQRRGYQPQDYESALLDDQTKFVIVNHQSLKGKWPLLANIQINSEYRGDYFARRYDEQEAPTYYLSLPPQSVLENSPRLRSKVSDLISHVLKQGARVVFDQRVGAEDTIGFVTALANREAPEDHLIIDEFLDSGTDDGEGSPAESVHYHAMVASRTNTAHEVSPDTDVVGIMRREYHRLVDEGEIDVYQPSRTIVIDPEHLDLNLSEHDGQTVAARLVQIYEDRFEALVDGDPVRDKQTPQELEALLRDPKTLVVARIIEGKIVGFTYIAAVENCEWLNQKHFDEAYKDAPALYFPGIAADRSNAGLMSTQPIIKLAAQLLAPEVERAHLVWQSTNISKLYVPGLVSRAIERSESLALQSPIAEVAAYRFFGVALANQQKSGRP